MKYVDRAGTSLEVGQQIRLQHCIGSYGKTQVLEGELLELSQHAGLTIRLAPTTASFTRQVRGQGGIMYGELTKPGDSIYVCVPPEGYKKFEDFEHGHETWVEVTAQAPKAAAAPASPRRRARP